MISQAAAITGVGRKTQKLFRFKTSATSRQTMEKILQSIIGNIQTGQCDAKSSAGGWVNRNNIYRKSVSAADNRMSGFMQSNVVFVLHAKSVAAGRGKNFAKQHFQQSLLRNCGRFLFSALGGADALSIHAVIPSCF